MIKHAISLRQFAWLVTIYIVWSGMMFLPKPLTEIVGSDAWVTFCLPLVYALFVGYVFYRLAIIYPGKNIFEINGMLLGKWGGVIANGYLLLYFWFIFVRDIGSYTSFLEAVLLPKTPTEITMLLFFIVLIYYAKTSIEVTARVNDFVFPFFLLITFSLPLLLANEVSITGITPFFTTSFKEVGVGSMNNIGWYGDIIVIGALLHTLNGHRAIRTAFRHAVIFSSFVLMFVLITMLIVLGKVMLQNENYPMYSLVSIIHITDFLDRIDLFLYTVYTAAQVIITSISFSALKKGFNNLGKDKDKPVFVKMLGLFLLMTSLLAFHRASESFYFFSHALPAFVLLTQPLLIGLLYVMTFRSKYKPALQQIAKEKKHDPTVIWVRRSRILLAALLVFAGIGLWLGRDFVFIGNICAVGYMVSMSLMLVCSFIEVHKSIV